jgi:hypothetical protein
MIICNCRNLSSSSSQMFTMTLQRGIGSLSPSSSRLLKLETSSYQLSRRTLLSFKSEASVLRQQQREADAVVASADEVEARLASLAAILRANELLDSGSETKQTQRPESDSGASILKAQPKADSSSAPTTQLKEDSSAPTVKLNGGSSSASTAPLREDSSSAPTIQLREDSSFAPTIQLREDSSSAPTIQPREDSSSASSAPQTRKDSALPLK